MNLDLVNNLNLCPADQDRKGPPDSALDLTKISI